MRRKIGSRIFLFFIAFMIMNIFLTVLPSIKAEILTTDFDDGTLTEQYSNSWLSTGTNNPTFTFIADDFARSGDKCYKHRCDSTTYFNYTYSENEILTYWELWVYVDDFGSDGETHRLGLSEANGTEIIRLTFTADKDEPDNWDLEYQSATLGAVTLVNDIPDDEWVRIKLTLNDRDNVTYNCSYGQQMGSPANVTSYNPRITQSKFLPVDNAQIYYFDDHTIVTGTDFESDPYGEEEQQTQICSGEIWNTPIKLAETWSNAGYGNNYLEIEYFSKVDGIIKGCDLYYRNKAVKELGITVNDFTATCNGVGIGNPDHMIVNGPNDNDWVMLRWEFSVSGGGQRPIFEFVHSTAIFPPGGSGWADLKSMTAFPEFTYFSASVHSHSIYYGDNVIQGSKWGYQYPPGSPTTPILPWFEFCYSEGDIYDPYDDVPYNVWTDKYTYKLPNDNKVKIGYQMPTTSAILRCYKNGVELKTSGFPHMINTFGGSFLFEAFESGTYLLSLMVAGSEQDNSSFIVNVANDGSTSVDNMITSFPNPSIIDESYTVNWRYDGTNGRIYTGYSPDASDSANYYSIPNIRPSNNGSLTVQGVPGDNVYWFLLNYTNTSVYSFIDSHEHKFIEFSSRPYIVIKLGGNVILDEAKVGLYTTLDAEEKREYTLEGFHPYPFSDVSLYANNEIISKVSTSFSVNLLTDYQVEERFYNFTLRVNINNTNTVIAYYRVTFIDNKVIRETTFQQLIQLAFPDQSIRFIVGISICLVITFLPFITALRLKKSHVKIDIPPILYVITFCIGTMVSYYIGFFPWEIAFFFCFSIVVATIMLWFIGKRSPTSE